MQYNTIFYNLQNTKDTKHINIITRNLMQNKQAHRLHGDETWLHGDETMFFKHL